MRYPGLSLFVGCVLAMPGLRGQNYYVNGLTGQDIPTNGTSATAPWKTIGYSLAQIPRPPATGNPLLYVAGNQVYSPATNGEAFPIRPAYQVWIEGTLPSFQRPVLKPLPGVTAFLYDPNESYLKNDVTVRYLAFDGGGYAVQLGAGASKKHAPRFQDCEFRNQTVAAVRIDTPASSSTNDPRFFQCSFGPLPAGFDTHATTANSVLYPDIDECTFTGITGTAIFVDDSAPSSSNVGANVHSDFFKNCGLGVHVRTSAAAATPDFNVVSCSFVDLQNEGVWFELAQSAGLGASVRHSSFVRCATGVRMEGVLASGSHSLALDLNSMKSCTSFGAKIDLSGSGAAKVSTQGDFYDGCATGLSANIRVASVNYEQTTLGDRALRNGVGFVVQGTTAGSGVSLRSSLACASVSRGIDVTGSVPTTVRSCTIADNPTGFVANGTAMTVDHIVLGGNGTNVVSTTAPAITYSCFQGSSYAGTGNLNQTDPLLIRPYYKLSAASPCLDKGNPAASLPATDYEGDPRASVSKQGGQALPDLGADEYVLGGSARKYGTPGFGYYFFFPEISAASADAYLGGTVDVRLTGALLPTFQIPATFAVLTLGLRDDSGPLPFELSALNAPGSLVWNDLLGTLGPYPVTPQGTSSTLIPIPLAPVLTGQTFTMQWFAFLREANVAGVTTSDGLRVTLGEALKGITEDFNNSLQLDVQNSAGVWGGGFATAAPIGGSGIDGEFSLQTPGIENLGPNVWLFRTTPEVVGPVNKWVTIPADRSFTNQPHQVTDGRLEFSSFVLPAGETLMFRGSLPPRISVRGTLDIQGKIVLNGGDITVAQSSRPGPGVPGALGACFGGNGGKGGNQGDGLSHQVAFDGSPGEDVKLLAGHAYASRAVGTGGGGSVQFPLNGLRTSITRDGISGAITDQVTAGGGGGGYDQPGAIGKAYLTLSQKAANLGPDSVGGTSFNNFPVPGGTSALDHFVVGGSGGGGSGSCPYFNSANPGNYFAGDGGAGGGGAIAFRAGSSLVLGPTASIEAKGGSSWQNGQLQNLPGGGGGSGGSILLQVAGAVGQSGLLTVAGGLGAVINVASPYSIRVQGGNGAPGYIRLETTQTPTVSLLGNCVPPAALRNVASLTETDARVGSQSLWYRTGSATTPQYVRYVVKAKVNGLDRLYTDDPALNLPLAKEGEAVELFLQGANLAANGQPIPGQISEWVRYAGSYPQNTVGRSLNDAGYTSYRFQMVLHRIGSAAVVVDNVSVYYR